METQGTKELLQSERARVQGLDPQLKKKLLDTRTAEGRDAHKRFLALEPIIEARLADTAFVKEQEWSQLDVQKTRDLLVELAPFAHPKVFPNYWEHLLAASIYARKVAEKARNAGLNPYEAEAMMLLHDLGRLILPHRYVMNEFVGDRLFKRAGVRAELLKKHSPYVGRIVGIVQPAIEKMGDLSIPQRIMDI